MTIESGRAAGGEPLLNEGSPWGGDGEGPKSPWSQPPRKRPGGGPGAGPSALDALIRRGRARLGGSGSRGSGPGLDLGRFWRWAVLGVVVLWVALTSSHTIGPQQRGVVTRFGRYVGTLQPGLGFSLPAPIDLVTKLDVDDVHTSDIDGGEGQNGQNLMLTGDDDIVDLRYQVRWSIRDPELYLFQVKDPEGTVREVTESAMREAVARASMADVTSGRGAIEDRVAARAQDLLDGYRSGVLIQGVAIKQADPPAAVADASKEVSAAQQTAQSYMTQARAYATQVTAKAQNEAAAFDRVYAQYALAPEVTRRRMYYETMEKVLAKTDKTIVDAPVNGSLPLTPAPRPGAAK